MGRGWRETDRGNGGMKEWVRGGAGSSGAVWEAVFNWQGCVSLDYHQAGLAQMSRGQRRTLAPHGTTITSLSNPPRSSFSLCFCLPTIPQALPSATLNQTPSLQQEREREKSWEVTHATNCSELHFATSSSAALNCCTVFISHCIFYISLQPTETVISTIKK